MAGDVVVIGEMVLDGAQFPFATPAKISGASGQMLGIAKLIGGDRVIDAMGKDPDPIRWSGRWRGPGAVANNDTMRLMANAGQLQPCTWGEYFFNVVIQKYTWEYEAYFEIPYTIELIVMPDADGGGGSSSLDDIVGSDMDSAQGAGAFQ